MPAKLIAFPARPATVQSVHPRPIPIEVQKALGLTDGLVFYGAPAPAKQLGSAEVRPLLKHA